MYAAHNIETSAGLDDQVTEYLIEVRDRPRFLRIHTSWEENEEHIP
jgi:hypothetical protein